MLAEHSARLHPPSRAPDAGPAQKRRGAPALSRPRAFYVRSISRRRTRSPLHTARSGAAPVETRDTIAQTDLTAADLARLADHARLANRVRVRWRARSGMNG